MKRKIAALLATVLVMTMGATTVFAAVSPTMDEKVNAPVESTATDKDGKEVVVTPAVVTDTAATSTATEAAKTEVNKVANVETAKVAALTEITVTGTPASETNPITIVMSVDGVKAGDNVMVLNYHDGGWKTDSVKNAKAIADGKVEATFTHLSPVMVITYTVATTTVTPPATTTDETPASPKTGVLPVAAIAAGICLAGAAVCGKKVKFN